MKPRPYLGYLLIGTGVLHTVLGLIVFQQPVRAMLQAGVINSIDTNYDRGMAFWFILFGVLAIVLGQMTLWAIRQFGVLPASLGWGLLGIAVVGGIVLPVSGFWLVFPQAVLLILSARGSAPPFKAEHTT